MGAARKRALSGFTLVELLIAMAISTLVIGLATFSFSLFSKDWVSRVTGFERAAARVQRIDLLSNAMSSAVPWTVRDRVGKYGYYFLGRRDGLTLVTAEPVFGGGAPAVIRVFRELEPGGSARLVYEEASLADLILSDADQVLPFKHRMVVASGLRSLEFRYFGWASPTERASVDIGGGKPIWWEEYDGLQRLEHPLRVAVSIDRVEAIYAMPERTGASAE
jgi:hypothetical protein